jgi:hypothetical protein
MLSFLKDLFASSFFIGILFFSLLLMSFTTINLILFVLIVLLFYSVSKGFKK